MSPAVEAPNSNHWTTREVPPVPSFCSAGKSQYSPFQMLHPQATFFFIPGVNGFLKCFLDVWALDMLCPLLAQSFPLRLTRVRVETSVLSLPWSWTRSGPLLYVPKLPILGVIFPAVRLPLQTVSSVTDYLAISRVEAQLTL